MKSLLVPIVFAVLTALCWGSYGPMIGNAKSPAKVDAGGWTPFKPYVFIGLAYLVWAILGGLVMMKVMGDTYSYSGSQTNPAKYGFLAGSFGAVGALFLTSAMMISRGNALLVMPIVFGGAVSMTAVIEIIRHKGDVPVHPLLWTGMAAVVLGIVLVATHIPHGHHGPKKPAQPEASAPTQETPPQQSPETTG